MLVFALCAELWWNSKRNKTAKSNNIITWCCQKISESNLTIDVFQISLLCKHMLLDTFSITVSNKQTHCNEHMWPLEGSVSSFQEHLDFLIPPLGYSNTRDTRNWAQSHSQTDPPLRLSQCQTIKCMRALWLILSMEWRHLTKKPKPV